MPTHVRVVAILAAYNEADVIGQVVADLIAQGVDVYLLDDGSTDGTVAAVEPLVGRGVLRIEPLTSARATPPESFDWERILRRKTDVAREIDADWFIHHDADEFRESPWRGVALRDAIQRVDAAGYNAIDFASLDFWPTHDRFRAGDDVRAAFTHYSERAPHDRVQVRAWKNTGASVDLASSGGHDAQFPGRRVFPIRFIARHYPIRSQAHGRRKVFQERRGRFLAAERARGWHVQYDDLVEGASFIRDPSTLKPYDPDDVRLSVTLRHRGVEALEAALDEARCVGDARRREIDAARLAIEAREREIEARGREIDVRGREIDRLNAAVARAGDELQVRGAEAAALKSEMERQSAEIAKAGDFIDHQARTIDNMQHAIDDRARRIDALHRSLSWRLTAPARALLRLLTGR